MSNLFSVEEIPGVSIMAYNHERYTTPIDLHLSEGTLQVELSLTLEQAAALAQALIAAGQDSIEQAQAKQMAAAHAERPSDE